MMFKKILAIVLVFFGLFTLFKKTFLTAFLFVLGAVIILFIIRKIADVFWWGKDGGKW